VTRRTKLLPAGQHNQLTLGLAQQQAALTDAAHAWHSALAASPFTDLAAFAAAQLSAFERQRLTQLKEACQQAQQQTDAVWHTAQAKQARLHALALTPTLLTELDSQRDTLQTHARTLSEQRGEKRALLTNDEQRRQSQQTLLAHIDEQAQDVDIWQRLDGLIGSAKGDKFRKFAQGLTLDHLLQLANRHLARLHGRYLLRRKTTGELELDIVDAWQGDTTRDTRTLSGGEGFWSAWRWRWPCPTWCATKPPSTRSFSTKALAPSTATRWRSRLPPSTP
jgi:exonuclease SbcC